MGLWDFFFYCLFIIYKHNTKFLYVKIINLTMFLMAGTRDSDGTQTGLRRDSDGTQTGPRWDLVQIDVYCLFANTSVEKM